MFPEQALQCTVNVDVNGADLNVARPINLDVKTRRIDELQLFKQYNLSSSDMDQWTRAALPSKQFPVPASIRGSED